MVHPEYDTVYRNTDNVQNESQISDMLQEDGNISESSTDSLSNDDSDATEYDTEDEAFPEVVPANLSPIPNQNVPAN